MAAMANILIKDDAAAPVEITFLPITDTPSPYYRGNIAGVPLAGQPRLTLTSEDVKSGALKLTAKLEVPVMETLGASGTSAGYVAPPKVAYVNSAIFTQFVDPRSTIADRSNLLKLALGFLQGASATTATGILANTAAGDAFKNSALPGPQFFANVVIPN